MNEILQLKGRFEQKDFGNKPGPSNIPKDKFVSIEHLINLKKDLSKVSAFWEKEIINKATCKCLLYGCCSKK